MKTKIKLYIEIDSRHSDKQIYYFVDLLKNNNNIEMVDTKSLADAYYILNYSANNSWSKEPVSRISDNSNIMYGINFYYYYAKLCEHYGLFTEFSESEYINLLKLSNSSDPDSRLLALTLWLKLKPSYLTNIGLYLIARHSLKDDKIKEIHGKLSLLVNRYDCFYNYKGLGIEAYYETVRLISTNKYIENKQFYLKILSDEGIAKLFIEKYSRFLKFDKISIIGLQDDKIQSTYDQSQITKEFGI